MRARTGLWAPRVGNDPGPPGPGSVSKLRFEAQCKQSTPDRLSIIPAENCSANSPRMAVPSAATLRPAALCRIAIGSHPRLHRQNQASGRPDGRGHQGRDFSRLIRDAPCVRRHAESFRDSVCSCFSPASSFNPASVFDGGYSPCQLARRMAVARSTCSRSSKPFADTAGIPGSRQLCGVH